MRRLLYLCSCLKKIVIWTLAVLLTPVLLFVVLAVLLYLPPVQNWVVDKVASVVSEKTGMTVRVGYVRLEWPLNLGLDDFLMVHEGDTLADVGHLTANVKLRPLFDKRVVVNELSLSRAKLNTNGFISDLRLKGRVGELWLRSDGIDLEHETAEVNGARLSDADLDIALSDTAAVDTTTTTVRWRINADSVSISRTRLALHMPGDSLHVNAYLGHSVAREADINLDSKTYRIGGLDMVDGDFSLSSVDYQLTDVQLGVDSIYYGPEGTRFYVRQAALREPTTGLQLTELRGGVSLDTAFTHVSLPAVVLRTPDSDIEGELDLDFNTFDAHNPGKLSIRLNAQIGKQDLMRLASHSFSSRFWRRYPNRALTIKGSLNGNMQRLEFTGLDVSLPTAFHLKADGAAHHLDAPQRLKADLAMKAETHDLGFVSTLVPMGDLRLPSTILQGRFGVDGKRYTADFTARQGQGTVKAQGVFNGATESYDADITIRQLNLKNFMPRDSFYTLTASARLRGKGFDMMQKGNRLEADVTVEQLQYGQWRLDGTTAQATLVDGRIQATLTGSNELIEGTINADALLRRDVTRMKLSSGDLTVSVESPVGYERLLRQLTTLGDSVVAQYKNKVIDQPAIMRLLPTMTLHADCRKDNLISELLKRTGNIDFNDFYVDLSTSPETGVNGQAYIHQLNYDSIRIDTINVRLTQKGERLTYQAQIRNNKKNPQFVFNALIDGHLHEHGALAGLRYYDDKDRLGVRIGATAEMEEGGIRLKLMPDRPTVGYKEFNLNKDNFIFLGADKRIRAKVDLVADDKTGIKIYTEDMGNPDALQDLTVSVNHLDLGELTSVMPYLPRITGRLNGDYHIVMDRQEHISVVSDMAVEQMNFEGSPIGNLSTELVYLMKDDGSHAIEARLLLDDEEFGLLDGTYRTIDGTSQGAIDATFTMTHFPLSMANGFVSDQLVGLEGFGEGVLSVKGQPQKPQIDGEIMVEDAYLISKPYGIRMRFDNDPVRVVNSHLLLENFGLYAYNEEPLNLQGDIDFSDLDHMKMDLQMRARNLLLINARQEPGSIAFGKAYVNFFARLQGPMDALKMRGRLDVLGATDLTYMLLDSPLSTDNRLDELVKFTDFKDSTQTIVTRPAPTGLDADLTLSVSQGAHIICNLNVEQTNYIDLMGGGDLRMRYNSEGIHLTGRYTLASGEMKYSLPVIPLKTFTISDGSYVEFTGDPMNPRLNITATERTKATVSDESGASRSVAFDCGVVITKTLSDMGLQFIINAPEDQTISGELTTMSPEERGKIAVTMLTTGMYLADGNTNGFSMNSALSSFLQNEINSIAGSALKTLDLQLGIDNTTDASGAMRTDYSFRFAKRFMNNRLKLQIGGKVSSGDSEAMGQQQSFFDNVTMEYRLNQEATQNVKLFYNQNVYDWLEGYTGEYGVGFVWRKKLDNFWDIIRGPQTAPTIQTRPVNVRTASDESTPSSDRTSRNETHAQKEN